MKAFLRLFLLLIFQFITLPGFAQSYSIKGTVFDESLQPVEYATVALLSPEDSTLTGFSLTNSAGHFEISNVLEGKFILQVSFLGYQTFYRSRAFPENDGDMGAITLKMRTHELSEAEISAERVPLRIMNDTVEYDAASFKTKLDAPVEDLLKKMPGIEVDRSGNIKAQGEDVKNVLVDGKEFFGNDPKLATKNLPADAVSKVQVYDKKSEEHEMTGVDDGIRTKTINLMLKEDKKSAWIGDVQGGIGSDNHFQGAAKAYRFTKTTQFALLGMMNNINQFGFSFQDYIDFNGGIRSMMGESGNFRIQLDDDNNFPVNFGQPVTGLISSGAGGLNYSYEKDRENRIFLSYLGSGSEKNEEERTLSRNFSEGSSFEQEENLISHTRNYGHRFNTGFRKKISSNQNLILNASANISDGTLTGDLNSSAYFNDTLINYFESINESASNGFLLNGNASYLVKWSGKWKLLKIGVDVNANKNVQNYDWLNKTEYFVPTQVLTENRSLDELGEKLNYSFSSSISRSIGESSYIVPAIKAGRRNETLDKRMTIPPGETQIIDSMTAVLDSDYDWFRPSLTFKRNNKKSQLSLSAQFETGRRTSSFESDNRVDEEIFYFLPQASWELEYKKGRSFRASYSTEVNVPDAWQMYPLLNTGNSIQQTRGNRDLKSEYIHSIRLHSMRFDQFSFTSVFAGLNLRYVKDKINWNSSIDSQLNQEMVLVNTKDNIEASATFEFSKPIRKLKLNISLDLEELYNRGMNYVNSVENINNNFRHSASMRLDNRKKEKIDASIGAGFQYNDVHYSIDDLQSSDFYSLSYFAELAFTPTDKWNFNLSADITQYSNETYQGRISVPMLKASINRYLNKNGRIVLGLEVFDILNKNAGLERITELNYIQQKESKIIGRYVMFSLKYRLNKFAGPGKDKVDIQINK